MKRLFIILLLLGGFNAFGQNIRAVKVSELQKLIRETPKPLIINFWATWCGPCIEEIPYFEKLVARHKDSIQLILVSLDFREEFPQGIAKAAAKRKFQSAIKWLNESNADYFCPRIDSSWGGALPASLFINNSKKYRLFREGQINEAEMEKLIRKTLN